LWVVPDKPRCISSKEEGKKLKGEGRLRVSRLSKSNQRKKKTKPPAFDVDACGEKGLKGKLGTAGKKGWGGKRREKKS